MNAPPRVVIAGGGVAALETALALQALAGDRVATTIISAQDDFVVRPLLVGEPFAQGRAPRFPLKKFASDVGCELVRGTVRRVDPAARQAHLDDGDPITYDTLVIAIGAPPVATFSRALTFTMEADPDESYGFIPVDQHGRVRDTEHVFGAGDATTWPVKQGGLATQQADVIAAVIASDAGADVDVLPYRPVLRGMLLTGVEDHYLRSTVGGVGLASDRLMWWPPSKIAGKYPAPYLAGETGETLMDLPTHENRIPIDVELDQSEAFG